MEDREMVLEDLRYGLYITERHAPQFTDEIKWYKDKINELEQEELYKEESVWTACMNSMLLGG